MPCNETLVWRRSSSGGWMTHWRVSTVEFKRFKRLLAWRWSVYFPCAAIKSPLGARRGALVCGGLSDSSPPYLSVSPAVNMLLFYMQSNPRHVVWRADACISGCFVSLLPLPVSVTCCIVRSYVYTARRGGFVMFNTRPACCRGGTPFWYRLSHIGNFVGCVGTIDSNQSDARAEVSSPKVSLSPPLQLRLVEYGRWFGRGHSGHQPGGLQDNLSSTEFFVSVSSAFGVVRAARDFVG